MDEKKNPPEKVTPKPPKKPRDLKAATHILKKVALQRYKTKLHAQPNSPEQEPEITEVGVDIAHSSKKDEPSTRDVSGDTQDCNSDEVFLDGDYVQNADNRQYVLENNKTSDDIINSTRMDDSSAQDLTDSHDVCGMDKRQDDKDWEIQPKKDQEIQPKTDQEIQPNPHMLQDNQVPQGYVPPNSPDFDLRLINSGNSDASDAAVEPSDIHKGSLSSIDESQRNDTANDSASFVADVQNSEEKLSEDDLTMSSQTPGNDDVTDNVTSDVTGDVTDDVPNDVNRDVTDDVSSKEIGETEGIVTSSGKDEEKSKDLDPEDKESSDQDNKEDNSSGAQNVGDVDVDQDLPSVTDEQDVAHAVDGKEVDNKEQSEEQMENLEGQNVAAGEKSKEEEQKSSPDAAGLDDLEQPKEDKIQEDVVALEPNVEETSPDASGSDDAKKDEPSGGEEDQEAKEGDGSPDATDEKDVASEEKDADVASDKKDADVASEEKDADVASEEKDVDTADQEKKVAEDDNIGTDDQVKDNLPTSENENEQVENDPNSVDDVSDEVKDAEQNEIRVDEDQDKTEKQQSEEGLEKEDAEKKEEVGEKEQSSTNEKESLEEKVESETKPEDVGVEKKEDADGPAPPLIEKEEDTKDEGPNEEDSKDEDQNDKEKSEAPEQEEGPPVDFFYDVEKYQSGSRSTMDSGIPSNMLQFFHSFGYDCRKRSNLHLLRGPTALFAAGNLVHLLNLTTGKHTFIRSCSGGGVGAIAVHPSGNYFAVAEKGVKPHVLVYEFPSLKLYRVLEGGTERAYSFVDFSPKGDLLASVGSYPDYMLTVWDWCKEKIMLRSKAFSQEVYRVTFSPEQEGQLTSSGTTHIRFWKMAFTFTGLKLKGELGRFGKTSLSDIDGYIQLPDGKVLSGCEWGNMLLWDGGLIKVEICKKNNKPCHIGSIQQLVIDEGELITIGLDGYVRVWEMEAIDTADTTDDSDVFEVEPMNELKVGNDVQLTRMVKATMEEDASMEEGASVWYAQDAGGGIWKLDLSFSHTTKPPEKLHSFTSGPITGMATSPGSHLVATTGDTCVRIYDYLTTETLCEFKAPSSHSKGTALAWPNLVVDPKGTTIVVGFSDGILRILELRQVDGNNELILNQVMKPHSSRVTSLAFDNSGEILATGSADKTVFFFSVEQGGYKPIGFVSIPGEVTGMEWSPPGFPDNTLLVSCNNGKVIEITAPSHSDTSHSFKLSNVPMKYFTFQSIKSRLRRDEEREKKKKEKERRRMVRVKELQRRKDRGEEISDEDAAAFLDDDPEDTEEEEEELFIPPQPNSILQAFYLLPGRFAVSMDDTDAGYLYECVFPDQLDEEAKLEPVRAIPVQDSSDVPITRISFTHDRRKLVAGFRDGMIRVYPLEGDPDAPFDLDLLGASWDMNMHDNDSGSVTKVAESHDGAYLFTAGSDGNIFGYQSLAHDEIVKSMEGKRAKLPSPKKRILGEMAVDDINDPNAYSIEDAKLKAEHDKMIRDAEAKKMAERRRVDKLRKTFLGLIQKNNELPDDVQLQRSEFELDPSIRHKMEQETESKIERVRLEMQWGKEKLALAHRKLEQRFRSQLECDRIIVHSFKSSHTVSSYRVARLPEEFHQLKEVVEQRVRAASLASEGGVMGMLDGTRGSVSSGRGQDDEASADETFIKSKQKKSSLLHGRQAEKVAKALKKAEEAKLKREKRQKEWEELFRSKPDENFEDPADVAAIKDAQANMGDFKLKTAPDYVVPEHLRMDTEKKRYQLLILQGLINRAKSEFNNKLVALRDWKLDSISEMKSHIQELKIMQKRMQEDERCGLPKIPRLHPDEEPHKKFEYTRDTLLKFEDDEKSREEAEAQKKRKGGGGLFGGFDDEEEGDKDEPDLLHGRRTSASSVATSVASKAGQKAQQAPSKPTILELQMAQIEKIRLKYQRDRLLRLIEERMMSFDAELRLLRHHKTNLDVDLKMADLRQVTLLEELLLLKEYEKRETTLSGRVMSKRAELAEINGKASEMQARLEVKKRDIDRLSDREKALNASFVTSLGDGNKFSDFLTKVFKKKIKRAKKKVLKEGEEEDSDVSSSDESDYSSEEDEDDSVEGGFDDSTCPPGCDVALFDSTLALREKRLDLEELLIEEHKIAETLKKDADGLLKKAKVMDSQLKTALADLEAFQVEKQGKLNELDVVVPLRLHQVEHVYNAAVPFDLSPCLIFANTSLSALQRRIKELQQEKSEQRKFYKEARQQHVHLIKNRRVMEERIEQLEEKCEHMMMLKFGRIVDLEKLDSVTINKNVEELKEQVRRQEVKNATELLKRQRRIEELRDRVTDLTRENTARLERLNVLVNDKGDLEQELDHRQRTMELEQKGRKKGEIREQHRLVQLVQLQSQEIQALKEEIGLLSRKGGHILPPAQPPLGQDTEAI